MRADVFTLFPGWFDWFREQRHVRNAISLGHSLETVDYRDYTTLSGRSVDDDDYGQIIGRGGRTASALRTVVMAAGSRQDKRVLIDIVD